jgi:hypothetical protein
MKDDARSDWLEIAKAHAQGIRTLVGASILLTLLIGLILWGKRHQLGEDEQKERSTACFLPTLPPYLTPDQGIQPSFPSPVLPAIVFILAGALVRQVQRCKSRALSCVSDEDEC